MEQLHNSNVNYGTGVKVGVLVGVLVGDGVGVGVEVGQILVPLDQDVT